MKKKIVCITAGIFTLAMSMTAMAGTWKEDATGKWYDNGDGTWPASTWQWIDTDGDGVSECFYFDGTGYMVKSVTTPDGYTVNYNGEWIANGVVQTKNQKAIDVAAGATAETEAAAAGTTAETEAAATEAASAATTGTAAGTETALAEKTQETAVTEDVDAKPVTGKESWAYWVYKHFDEEKVLNTGSRGRFMYRYPDATTEIAATIPRNAENVMMIGEYWKNEFTYAGWTKVNFNGTVGYIQL